MIELYIAGQRVTLTGSEVIAPTYQAFDVADITKIKFDFSNTFTIPYCRENDLIFENAFRVQSQSEKRYLANECKLLIGGRELIANGVAELIGTDDKGYKVVVYSLPLEFFNQISGLNIRDLDYTGYDHLNTVATVVASQARTDKYIYPLIDWHSDSPNDFIRSDIRSIDTRYMMPCLFSHELLNKIFTEAGYTLVNNTELHPMFQAYDLVLTTDNKNSYLLYYLQSGELPNGKAIATTDLYKIYFSGFSNDLFKGESKLLETRQANYDIELLSGKQFTETLNIQFIKPLENAVYEFKIQFDADFDGDLATIYNFSFVIVEANPNQTQFDTSDIIYTNNITPISRDNETYNISTFVNCNKDKRYFFAIQTFKDFVLVPAFEVSNVTFSVEQTERFILPYVPDIEQKDLIKNYLQLTGSFITFDSYTKKFTIDRFDKVIENKPTAKDWTEKKWNNNVKPKIDYKVGNYGVSNKFRYADDENDFKPNNADGEILSTNQNLNKEYDVLELLFASSIMAVTLKNLQIAKINSFEAKTGEVTIGSDVLQIPLDSKFRGEIVPRILLIRRETLEVLNPVGFTDGTNTVLENEVAIAHFIDVTQSYSLGFGSNIIDTFYQWLQAILNDTIVIEDEYKLTGEDVAANELDFLTPVYMQQHNNYFYINKISNFVDNKKTKVQLIKI